MTHRGRAAPALAVALCLLAASPAQAGLPTPASGATWNPNQKVAYRWKEDSVPPAWMKPAIHAAAADSNQSRASRAAILSYAPDAPSWIAYTPDMPNGAIGYAVRNVPDSFKVRLIPHGHVFDWGTLHWCQFYDTPPSGCYDAEMVALHELGHVQTLGHIEDSPEPADSWLDSIMHVAVKSKAKTGWNMHEFGRCDVARLQIRYETLDTRTPYSTCLALPTTLALTTSSGSADYGTNVTLTATLSISSGAQYPNLAGDRLSGRTVQLQRRASSSDAWSTVAEMSALSDATGRYTKSVKVTTFYEWRARFVAPADEGLTNSTSAVVRIYVSGCATNCGCAAQEPTSVEEPDGEDPSYVICGGSALAPRVMHDGRG